jgi:uncharacterized protein
MKLIWFVSAVLIILIISLILLFAGKNDKPGSNLKEIEIGASRFYVKIADTNLKKAKGLSGKELAKNQGMLFTYQSLVIPKFWMKGMIIGIDIIWIKENEVVEISKNITPQNLPFPKTVSPKSKVDSVLEISAGEADRLGIKPGDKVSLNR